MDKLPDHLKTEYLSCIGDKKTASYRYATGRTDAVILKEFEQKAEEEQKLNITTAKWLSLSDDELFLEISSASHDDRMMLAWIMALDDRVVARVQCLIMTKLQTTQ